MAIWTKYGPTNRAICFWKKGCELLQPKSVLPEKYSDFLFPLFERLQKMSSLFREKTIDTILHMRIIYAEIQNLLKEIFHLLKEKKCISKTSSNNPDIFCRIHSNRDKQLLRCGQTVEMPLLYEPAVTDLIRNSFDIFLTLRCNVSCFIYWSIKKNKTTSTCRRLFDTSC